MADHLDDDVILTHLAELENDGLFESPSPEARRITPGLASGSDRSPGARATFKNILNARPAENIETLLERSVRRGGNIAPIRFNFAINRLLARIGWDLDLKPLHTFLGRQFWRRNTRHTFISFNYDLVLDRCVQLVARQRWNIQQGYGFPIRYAIKPDEGMRHMQQFEGVGGAFGVMQATQLPEATDTSIRILKPHGSVNFIFPFEGNYQFKDGPTITILTEKGEIAYYQGFNLQHVALTPGMMPEPDSGLYLVPPTSAKTSDLEVIQTIRQQEQEALQTADEVYVIGWSMPVTDTVQYEFIKEAVQKRMPPIKRVVAISYGASREYLQRLAAAFQVREEWIEGFNKGFRSFVHNLAKHRT